MLESTVNILHLSDLHFGAENSIKNPTALAQRKIALDSLVDTISKVTENEKPDIVVISGDITWQGSKEGFEQAAIWIEKLLIKLNLTTTELIICAGNHDIDRRKTKGMNPPNNSRDADDWLSLESLENFINPFSNYSEFCESLGLPFVNLNNFSNYLVGVRDIRGIRFLVLNSAWFCRGNDDVKKLWLGLPQLQLLESQGNIKMNSVDHLTISIVHHPSNWFHEEEIVTYERPATYRYLSERSHLILSGHVHGAIENATKAFDNSYVIINGASYAGNNLRNNFSILQINKDNQLLKQIPFEYDPRFSQWERKNNKQIDLKKKVDEVQAMEKQSTKSIFNVPFRKHPYFLGRSTELKTIYNFFSGNLDSTYYCIYGLSGIGKTQLAIEYAYEYQSEYDVIWWFHSEEASSLLMDIERFCIAFNLITIESELLDNFKKFVSLDPLPKSFLLIFDNVSDEDKILSYLPFKHSGFDVLITSNNPNWRKGLQLGLLDAEVATDFVLQSTDANEDYQMAALELSNELGFLPLALEQAVAYIKETGVSIQQYLERFRKYRKELAREGKPLNYNKNIATTWKLLLETISEDIHLVTSLFNYICFLSVDNISKDFLLHKQLSPYENIVINSEMELDRIVGRLRRLSLVKMENGIVSIHRLVVAMTIDFLDQQVRKDLILHQVNTMWGVYQAKGKRETEILEHSDYILKHVVDNDLFNENIADLMAAQARVQLTFSNYENALILSKYLYQKTMTHFQGDYNRLAKASSRLGTYYYSQGQYVEARDCLSASLQHNISKEEKLSILNILVNVEQDSGRLNIALEYVKKIDEILELHPEIKNDHHEYSAILNSKNRLFLSRSEFDKAEDAILEAISISKKKDQTNVYGLSTLYSNLGHVYDKKGEIQRSIECYQRAIENSKKLFNENHEFFARDYSNLGLAYYYLYDTFHAKRYLRKALEIAMVINPFPNNFTANILNNLGMVFEAQGKTSDALEHFLEAMEMYRSLNQEDNQDISMVLYNIGGAYQHLGQLDTAEEYVLKALEIDSHIYSENHPEIAKDLGKLAVVMLEKEDYKKAIIYLNQAVYIYEYHNLIHHIEYASAIGHKASAIYVTGNKNVAKMMLIKSLDIIAEYYGSEIGLSVILFSTFVIHVENCGNQNKELTFLYETKKKYL
ncbi:tetratricopeptide repeat protein [Paenibacillus monticola]|uniref:Tetratricopeptide repeat protein n=1 Tax=Paenibacillus monticola TaxID=2666075 RepID=A0A7X2HA90_9BACL|nr:tetratricopeptide repeat protein [Paenibacillus monticola]MRN56383.1 tetratricopeptide repeat protein [Paenibacillus monticola]